MNQSKSPIDEIGPPYITVLQQIKVLLLPPESLLPPFRGLDLKAQNKNWAYNEAGKSNSIM